MTRSQRATGPRWRAVWVVLLIVFAAAVVFAVRILSDESADRSARAGLAATAQARIECISEWISAYTTQSEKTGRLNKARIDALDKLARALQDADPAKLKQALDRYITASDQYRSEAAIPAAPPFTCGSITASPAPTPQATRTVHSTVTVHRSATPGPTRTVTVHAHAAGPVPVQTRTEYVVGPTRTITAPGRTTTIPAPTRTVTRVATRTVAVPGPRVTLRIPGPTITVPGVATIAPPCLLGLLLCP